MLSVLPVLLLLSALGGLLPRAAAQERVFLHQAPYSVHDASLESVFYTPLDAPSMTGVRTTELRWDFYKQGSSSAWEADNRWGRLFSLASVSHSAYCPRLAASCNTPVLVIPSETQFPVLIQHTQTWAAFFQSSSVSNFPSPPAEVLAAIGIATKKAFILGARVQAGGVRTVFLSRLEDTSLSSIPLSNAPAPTSEPVLGVPGPGRVFYLLWAQQAYRVLVTSDSSASISSASPVGAFVQAFATRLVTSASDCPDAADLVVIDPNGGIRMMPCHGGSAPAAATLATDIPPGTPLEGRFLMPLATTTGDLVPYFYYAAPAGGALWRVDVHPVAGATWRPVTLPPGVPGTQGMEMIRLRSGVLPSGQWALVDADRQALFDSETFGCHSDPSIMCDSPTGTSASTRAWRCADDRAESPAVSPDQMCAGCPAGWYLDRPSGEAPFASPGHTCRKCLAANCLTCNALHCLVCQSGYMPQPDPISDRVICVTACSPGYQAVAGVCQPQEKPLPTMALAQPQPELVAGLPTGAQVTAIGETSLSLDSAGAPIAPSAGAPPGHAANLLVFVRANATRRVYLMPKSHIGQSNNPPLLEVAPLPWTLTKQVVSFMEMGPFVGSSKVTFGHVFCFGDGTAGIFWTSCPGSPPTGPCTAPTQMPNFREGCRRLWSLGPRRIARELDDQAIDIYTADLTGDEINTIHIAGLAHVVHLADPPAGGPPAARSHLDTWLLASGHAWPATALPVGYLTDAALSKPLHGRLLAGMPNERELLPIMMPLFPDAPGTVPELVLIHWPNDIWTVRRVPGDVVPSGRSVGLAPAEQALGQLPASLGSVSESAGRVRFQALDLSAAMGWEYPSALLLLAREFLGVALFRCSAPTGPCAFLPAHFTSLPAPLPGSTGLWLAAVNYIPPGLAGGATLRPPSGRREYAVQQNAPASLDVLLFAEDVGLTRAALAVECPAGTFPPACDPCDGLCRECSGPGRGNCTACRTWLASQPGVCLDDCPEGLKSSPTGECTCQDACLECGLAGQTAGPFVCTKCMPQMALVEGSNGLKACEPCHDTCAECMVPRDSAACVACSTPRFLHQGLCLEACPGGTWPDGVDRQCRSCPAGCTACSGADACSACVPRFFLAGSMCAECDASCASCQDGSSCLDCRPGMVFLRSDPGMASLCGTACAVGEYAGADRCTPCAEACALCAGPGPAACQVCATGYRWAEAAPAGNRPGTCVECPLGCASCTRADVCMACMEPLLLTSEGTCTSTCPAGSHSNGESCQPCDVSCVECVGPGAEHCTLCEEGLEFQAASGPGGFCVSPCPEGQYREAAGAACVPCHEACATCNGPTDRDCWRCNSGLLQAGECVQACASTHVAEGNQCKACHKSCRSCTGVLSTDCLECSADMLALLSGPSQRLSCVTECGLGSKRLDDTCTQCEGECAACPESVDTCTTCKHGWKLFRAGCVGTCPAESADQGNVCSTCHASCGTCYGPNPGNCTSCPGALPLLHENHCYDRCPGGTFQAGQECQPCGANCAACSGPQIDDCTGCPVGRVLKDGMCLAACPTGWYDHESECARCLPACHTCDRAEGCTGCRPGEAFLGPSGLCEPGCPEGWLACSMDAQCRPCPPGCATCASAKADCAAECQSCEQGLFLSAGRCLEACPPGEFLHPEANACQACTGKCKTCHGAADMCTSCSEGYLSVETGICLSQCPGVGYAMLAGPDPVCLACPDGCERCTADESDPGSGCTIDPHGSIHCPRVKTCDICHSGRLLLRSSECVPKCPEAGYFPDHEAPRPMCVPCHAQCSGSCSGPGADGCTASPGMRRKLDGTVLNTIVELSLPGVILVHLEADFLPLPDGNLGVGGQARVFAARAIGAGISERLGCPDTVAIKILKADKMTPVMRALFQSEVALMWLFRDCPNIVQLYGYSEEPPALVMERFDTDLATILHSDLELSQETVLHLIEQWASGLEIMHAQGVAHRDLKPGNVFVKQAPGGGWYAALGDLGTSQSLSQDRSSVLVNQAPELNALTVRYAAPEVMLAFEGSRAIEKEYLLPADIYSAAIMLWECLTRSVPWKGCPFKQIALNLRVGDRPVVDFSGPLADLVTMAWDTNPHARPLGSSFRQKVSMELSLRAHL